MTNHSVNIDQEIYTRYSKYGDDLSTLAKDYNCTELTIRNRIRRAAYIKPEIHSILGTEIGLTVGNELMKIQSEYQSLVIDIIKNEPHSKHIEIVKNWIISNKHLCHNAPFRQINRTTIKTNPKPNFIIQNNRKIENSNLVIIKYKDKEIELTEEQKNHLLSLITSDSILSNVNELLQ